MFILVAYIFRTENRFTLFFSGFFAGWNGLLGRKSLQDVNKFFREQCAACSASASVPATLVSNGTRAMLNLVNSSSGANSCTHELPSVVSACLVSLEPQNTFRVYPGVGVGSSESWGGSGVGGGGGGGGSGGAGGSGTGGGASAGGPGGAFCGVSPSPFMTRTMMMVGSSVTPSDIPTTTHILVFPTSTSASGHSVSPRYISVIIFYLLEFRVDEKKTRDIERCPLI